MIGTPGTRRPRKGGGDSRGPRDSRPRDQQPRDKKLRDKDIDVAREAGWFTDILEEVFAPGGLWT